MDVHVHPTVTPATEVEVATKRIARHFDFCLTGDRFKSVRIDEGISPITNGPSIEEIVDDTATANRLAHFTADSG